MEIYSTIGNFFKKYQVGISCFSERYSLRLKVSFVIRISLIRRIMKMKGRKIIGKYLLNREKLTFNKFGVKVLADI